MLVSLLTQAFVLVREAARRSDWPAALRCAADAVTTAIAGLSVSGVTVLDMDKVPENAIDACPCLYPTPDNFVTDIVFTRQPTGGDSYAKLDLAYTLHYRYRFTRQLAAGRYCRITRAS